MVLARRQGILGMVGICTFLALALFFVYYAVFSVHVTELLGYDQIDFPLYLFAITIACAAFFRPLGRMNLETRYLRWVQAIKTANIEILILAAIFAGLVFVTKDKAISRMFLVTYLVGSWVLLMLINRFLPTIFSILSFGKDNQMRALLIGRPDSVKALDSWLKYKSAIGLEVLGLATPEGHRGPDAPSVPWLGTIEDLEKIITEKQISHIVLIDSRGADEWVQRVARDAYRYGCRIWIYNYWQAIFNQPLVWESDQGHAFFTFHEEPLDDPLSRLLKRALDIAISLPVVTLALPPIMFGVWLGQKMQSPGRLFFRQRRLGRGQKPFMIYKFRTMHDSEAVKQREKQQATKGDDRIFPLGRLLRATSIDEVPQFINVLKGEMSIVGPRPHMIEHDDEFAQMAEAYKARHFIKPGITGLAQTKGFRGEITDPERLRDRVRYDIEYISRWSIWLDISLIAKTFLQVFRPPSTAY